MAKTFDMLMKDDRTDFPTEMQTCDQLLKQLPREQMVQFGKQMRKVNDMTWKDVMSSELTGNGQNAGS